jgi:protein-S-isoprenylcysteine O-methyltransferase Ste14
VTEAIPRVVRDRHAAASWFVIEAVLVGGFWLAMAMDPRFRQPFTIGEGGERFLPAFAAADGLIVASSIFSALALWREASWAWIAMLVTALTSAYPAIFTTTTVMTGQSGEVPATLMAGLVVVNFAFAIGGHRAAAIAGRQAIVAPAAVNFAKTCGELVVLWVPLLWILPNLATGLESRLGWRPADLEAFSAIGALTFVAGTALLMWSAGLMAVRGQGTPFPFDAPRSLVITGPYAFIRNPQVVGGLLQGGGLLLTIRSPLFACCLAAGVLLWQVVLRPWEEAALVERFGAEYEAYRASVTCWIPRLTRYRPHPAA